MTDQPRFDRTLRVVLPHRAIFTLGLATIGCAIVLAASGAVTFVFVMLRLRDGDYLLPRTLHLPLPAVMRPPT